MGLGKSADTHTSISRMTCSSFPPKPFSQRGLSVKLFIGTANGLFAGNNVPAADGAQWDRILSMASTPPFAAPPQNNMNQSQTRACQGSVECVRDRVRRWVHVGGHNRGQCRLHSPVHVSQLTLPLTIMGYGQRQPGISRRDPAQSR